jgi:glutathione S-transferase
VSLNPVGDLPMLVDGDVVLTDLPAMLFHLCRRYDPAGRWRGDDVEVGRWIAFAAGPLGSVSRARASIAFGAPGDRETLLAEARAALRTIEDQLTGNTLIGLSFIAAKEPTLADIAVFPAVALSHDCGIGHEDYPAINLWQRRIRRLPRFVTMPGIPDYF